MPKFKKIVMDDRHKVFSKCKQGNNVIRCTCCIQRCYLTKFCELSEITEYMHDNISPFFIKGHVVNVKEVLKEKYVCDIRKEIQK